MAGWALTILSSRTCPPIRQVGLTQVLGPMSAIRALRFLAAVCLLCGCSSWRDWQMEKSLAQSQAAALAKIDQEQCRADGGFVRGVGMFGTPACVKPFSSAWISRNARECARRQSMPLLVLTQLVPVKWAPMTSTGAMKRSRGARLSRAFALTSLGPNNSFKPKLLRGSP